MKSNDIIKKHKNNSKNVYMEQNHPQKQAFYERHLSTDFPRIPKKPQNPHFGLFSQIWPFLAIFTKTPKIPIFPKYPIFRVSSVVEKIDNFPFSQNPHFHGSVEFKEFRNSSKSQFSRIPYFLHIP